MIGKSSKNQSWNPFEFWFPSVKGGGYPIIFKKILGRQGWEGGAPFRTDSVTGIFEPFLIKINYKNRQKENDEFGRTEERFLKWSSNCVWWSPGVFDTPPLQPAAMNTDANREYHGTHIGTEWSIMDTDPPSNSIQLTCIGVCHQAWLGNTFHLSSETNPFMQSICSVWCHITIFTSTISHVSISLGGICPHTTNSAVPYLTRSINWGGRKTSKIRLLFRAWHSCCRGRRRSWRWKEKYISPPQCSIFASGAQLQPTVPSLTTNASNPIGRNTP